MTTSPSGENLGTSHTKLKLVDAVAQSVGFMGPVFSIAFLVPLVMGITSATGNGAGVAAPLAVLIAAIGVLAFGWIIAEYARRIHAAGSLYVYVTDGLGNRLGGASGFLYYSGIIALGAAILIMLGGTIHDTLLAEFHHAFLSELGWDIVLLVIACLTVFFGVALSTRTQLILALVSITVVSIFFVYVIIKVGSDNDVAKAFNPSNAPNGMTGVIYGVLYGVLLFTGFETAANLGEETEHPARDIPRAVLFSVLGITAFYLVGSYAQVAGFNFDLKAIGQAAGAPLFALASPSSVGGYGSVAVVRLLELVVMLDMLAVMIGCATAGSRGLFALGRDGRLPRAMGKSSSRGTPLVAGTVLMVLFAITIAVTIWWTSLWQNPALPHYVAVFSVLAGYGSLAIAAIYFLLCIGAVRGLADHPKYWAVILSAVVGVIVTGAAIFGAVYKQPSPLSYLPYVAVVIFVIGLLVPGDEASSGVPLEPDGAPVKL
ncbi:MAG: APC family permease [Nocardioides sp.]